MAREKPSTDDITDTGLISKICKKSTPEQEAHNIVLKGQKKNLPKYYSKEDIQVKNEMRNIQHQTIKGYK